MVYREGNQILKILLVFVISILLLTSIIYLVLVAKGPKEKNDLQEYLTIPNPSEIQLNPEIDDYLIEIIDTETAN